MTVRTKAAGLGCGASLVLAMLSLPTLAAGADIAAGRRHVEQLCSHCHNVGPQGASPHDDAPPFRTLKKSYDLEDLAEALAEGIITGHEEMPEFQFEPEAIDDIIAYLKTL